jgi:hypothetical protein
MPRIRPSSNVGNWRSKRHSDMGDTGNMPAWKDYQEATARYYRELGLAAQTDAPLEGARGRHKVDVAVRGRRAGVAFLWIVECKHWNRRVDKSVVSNLRDIVQDVGADRGIILSRRGFQSGAPMLANKSNITLTSLDELQEDTEDEYIEYQCALVIKRCKAVMEGMKFPVRYPAGASLPNPFELIGRAGLLARAAEAAIDGKWPIGVTALSDGVESRVRATNFADLMQFVEGALTEVEADFAKVKALSITASK